MTAAGQSAGSDVNHGIVIGNEPYLRSDSTHLMADAAAAEAAGWDGVFLGDHLCADAWTDEPQAMFDPWMTLAGIAARTDHITLGTWVSPIPRRQPWQLARNLATLDRLSNGRVFLGAGLGAEPAYEAIGEQWDPVHLGQRYDEALDIITGLWTGEPFSYDGDHFAVENAVVLPTPIQAPRIPIVTGCWWPNRKPFERGARWDGIMPNWRSLFGRASDADDEPGAPEDTVSEMLAFYHEIADDPGEIVLPIDPVGATPAYVETCKEHGATWLLTTHIGDRYTENGKVARAPTDSVAERIRRGPPA